MEIESWNNWINKIDSSSIIEIESEIANIENNNSTPYVEKNLKLGYLYYSKDYLGTATKIFKTLAQKISDEKNNFDFIKENKTDLNVLYMGFKLIPDGCGGFEVVEDDCGSDCCVPFCGCMGIIVVMSVCGISASDITTCDTTDGQGCCDNSLNSCSQCFCCDICRNGGCKCC